jgi:hypothetical protein
MGMKHLGRIRVSSELILEWLDYTNADIRDVKYHYLSDSIELLLECDEFPEYDPRIEPELIHPIYTTYQDASGNKVVIRNRV